MIVRKESDGTLLMIGQTEHSQLVGQLGAHWGNSRFAGLRRYDSVIRAAAYHDYGWLRYETAPVLAEGTTEVPDFRKVGGSQLDAYQWCIDWMTGIDRYSGLIVSMHRTGLWRNRYDTIAYPTAYNPKAVGAATETFIARNEAWQEAESKALDEAELWTNYRLLQVWDLLGLYFCCQDPREDHIEPVPVAYTMHRKDGVKLTMSPIGPRKVAFDPFPFDTRPLRIQLLCHRMPQAEYSDLETYRRDYFRAPSELLEFELI